MMMAAWFWSFGALAAISQQLKNEYHESYLTMIAAAGCVESYLNHSKESDFSFLKTCGWNVEYFDLGEKKLKTHFFVARKEIENGQIVYLLIFRGTSELNDWGFNLKTSHCVYGGMNLVQMEQTASETYDKTCPAVHKGFNLYVTRVLRDYVLEQDGVSFKNLFAEVKNNPRCHLLIAGHSLGGAVAALLGQRLYDLGLPQEKFQVMTFGAPAVGNAVFAEKLGNRISLVRYTTTADPVPLSVQTLFKDYRHFGRQVKYDVDIRSTDSQHNCTLYLDNAFLQYYGLRRKIEQKTGRSLRPQNRVTKDVPLVGVQVSLSREAMKYKYMPELQEFLLDQYAGCLPSYRILTPGQSALDCRYRIYCEINGRQDRREKAWYVEVSQNLYKEPWHKEPGQFLNMAIYSKRVASGSGNVKTLAENWLEARGDLQKQLPFLFFDF